MAAIPSNPNPFDVDFWAKAIGQIGFPIMVAVYLLVRLDGQMQNIVATCTTALGGK